LHKNSLILAVVLTLATAAGQAQQQKPCHWWQFGHCDNTVTQSIEGLPNDAPRSGTVITIDLSTNSAYLFQDGRLVRKSAAATGSGKSLINGDDEWVFDTPRGHLKVKGKIVDPVWHKPDWAFIEAGERVPPPDSPKRDVHGHLGKYALALGDGILIHGTDDPDSIGQRVSHGCIRLPESMLETVYKAAKVGTDVYIFESAPQQRASSTK